MAAIVCCSWFVTSHTAVMAFTTLLSDVLLERLWVFISTVISASADLVRRSPFVCGKCGMTMFLMADFKPFIIIVVRQSSGMVESMDNFQTLKMYWSTVTVVCWVMYTIPRLNGTWGLKRAKNADFSSFKEFCTAGASWKYQSLDRMDLRHFVSHGLGVKLFFPILSETISTCLDNPK